MPENQFMKEIFGSDLCPSEEASCAPESSVPSPCATNETSTGHRVYSKEERRDEKEDVQFMNEIFGSDFCSSDEASLAPESSVPSPGASYQTSTRRRIYSKEDRSGEKENLHFMNEIFGSDLCPSEEASLAPEFSVPSSATNEILPLRRVYSKENLRALRHDRVLALPKPITKPLEGPLVPSSATNEVLPLRRVYSKETLRALRHDRVLALPKPITKPLEGPRCEIPTLNPNEPTAFSKLSLPKELLHSLSSLSLTTATAIQSTAIPYARLGADLVAQATSGTGKTLTYALVALDAILPSSPKRSALVIVPTRELAYQVADLFSKLAAVRVVTLVGGTKESLDEENLSRPANVIVGTPGRVDVMIARGVADVSSIKVLVLDEADRLLDGSFWGSVERICNMIPARQTLAFSATFSYSFRVSLMGVMREPKWIGGSDVIHSVVQRKVKCRHLQHKIAVLKGMLQPMNMSLCLIFFNAKKAAGRLVRTLSQSLPFASRLVHAGITQKERDAVIREVRQGKVHVLVTTDVLARGIDFDSCDVVIHMDVPQAAETYLHRVGRAGRFGRKGSSTLLFDEAEVSAVQALEADIGYDIKSPPATVTENTFMPIRSRPDGTNAISNRGVPATMPSEEDIGRNRVKRLGKIAEMKAKALKNISHATSPPLRAREDAIDALPSDYIDMERVTTPTSASEAVMDNSPQKFVKPSSQISFERVSQSRFTERKNATPKAMVLNNITEDMPSTPGSKKFPLTSVPSKRPGLLEEPATPAKKRKSARKLIHTPSETREAPIAHRSRDQSSSYLNAVTPRSIPPRVENIGPADKKVFALTRPQADADAAGVPVLNEQSQNCDESMRDPGLVCVPVDESRIGFAEKCREEWDNYAAEAYDAGYREAYEEAFEMAVKIRRRLLRGDR